MSPVDCGAETQFYEPDFPTVAVHEAGHAVVAIKLGVSFREIRIWKEARNGDIEGKVAESDGDADPRRVICYAGPVAEILYRVRLTCPNAKLVLYDRIDQTESCQNNDSISLGQLITRKDLLSDQLDSSRSYFDLTTEGEVRINLNALSFEFHYVSNGKWPSVTKTDLECFNESRRLVNEEQIWNAITELAKYLERKLPTNSDPLALPDPFEVTLSYEEVKNLIDPILS